LGGCDRNVQRDYGRYHKKSGRRQMDALSRDEGKWEGTSRETVWRRGVAHRRANVKLSRLGEKRQKKTKTQKT